MQGSVIRRSDVGTAAGRTSGIARVDSMRHRAVLAAALLPVCALLTACAGQGEPGGPETRAPTAEQPAAGTAESTGGEADPDQEFPDVLAAGLMADGDGHRIEVTVSSPYDTPERYAAHLGDSWGCQAARLTAGFMMVSYSMGVNRPRRACRRRR